MKKTLLGIVMLCLSLSGCATITNTKKPPLRTAAALSSALDHEVIEYRYRYFWGNVGLGVIIPIAGIFIAPIGMIADYSNGSNYAVVDKEKYQIWKEKYLRKQNEYFRNNEA